MHGTKNANKMSHDVVLYSTKEFLIWYFASYVAAAQ